MDFTKIRNFLHNIVTAILNQDGADQPETDGGKMKLDFQAETIKAAPAVAGTITSAVTLNQCVAIATMIYVCLQILYLLWKWRREAGKSS